MQYRLEQRIHTLAQNLVGIDISCITGFTSEQVSFSPWLQEPSDYWGTHPYWLATFEVDATDYVSAWRLFLKSLVPLVSRIALVSQCYTQQFGQPILIERLDLKVAFVSWILDQTEPAGLMFMEDEKKVLDLLLKRPDIPNEFFYYWRDAVNTHGYSSRLLLMLSAVEALTDIPYAKRKGANKEVYYQRLEQILGKELKELFWGTKDNHGDALRHRLTHGEYFDPQDTGETDYRGRLHSRIMEYLNEAIIKESLLDPAVVNAPRHPFGNADQARSFLRARGNAKLCLIDVLRDAESNDIKHLANYETLRWDEFPENF